MGQKDKTLRRIGSFVRLSEFCQTFRRDPDDRKSLAMTGIWRFVSFVRNPIIPIIRYIYLYIYFMYISFLILPPYSDKTDKMTKPWDAGNTRALDADDLSALLTGADKTRNHEGSMRNEKRRCTFGQRPFIHSYGDVTGSFPCSR